MEETNTVAGASVSKKRKRVENPEDNDVSPRLKIEDLSFDKVIRAGCDYGKYARKRTMAARTPIDFATFIGAQSVDTCESTSFVLYILKVHAIKEQIARTTSSTSVAKTTDIKLAVDIIESFLPDIRRTSSKLAAQFNTIMHNSHSCLKSNNQHMREYIEKTQEHFQRVQSTQELLQGYGSEAERKLKRIADIISDRLEKLQKLQALLGNE